MKEKKSNDKSFRILVIAGISILIIISFINLYSISSLSHQVNEDMETISTAYDKNTEVYNKNVDANTQVRDKINEIINTLNSGITIKR